MAVDDHGFHCNVFGSRSQNPRGTRFPANSRFSRSIFRKNLEIKYSRNMAHDFPFFAKLSEKIKGDTRVCMGNRTYIK